MVSIIVPVYKAEPFLDECIKSIIAQTYKEWELLLVDDGSPDRCPQICDSWSELDIRIKTFHKKNGGVSSARNVGLENAKGEYVFFVDSDDTIPQNALEILQKKTIENNSDLTIGGFCFQYGSKKLPHISRLKKGKDLFEHILPDIIDDGTLSGFLFGSVCGGLYKLDLINRSHIRFIEGLKNNEDGLFNFNYALCAKSFYVVDEEVYNYRQDELPSKPNRKNENFGEKVFELLDKQTWDKRKYDYDKQKARRSVTLAWWDILHFAKEYPFLKSIAFIHSKTSHSSVREGLKYMRPKKMNLYKRVVYYLIKYKMSTLFYFILRFVMPVMQKRVVR